MLSITETLNDYLSSIFLFLIVPIFFLIALSQPALVDAITSSASSSTSKIAGQNNPHVVYRIHQLDLPYGQFGSKSSSFNLEALTVDRLTDFFVRKCIILKWDELFTERNFNIFVEKILQNSLVSGVLIIFDNIRRDLTLEEMKYWQKIENKLLNNGTLLPIYFIKENDEINKLYEELRIVDKFGTGKSTLEIPPKSFSNYLEQNIFADSYQLVVNGPQVTAINDPMITNFQAKLVGTGVENHIPTYVIVSHYDSYSIVPSLSYGIDSNASGLIIFFELMRIFSKLYSDTKTRPKANLVFLLTGGGNLNYFGTKKWLIQNLDPSASSSSISLFENLKFAICLESLADSMNGNGLFMYVSKPPKPGTAASNFLNNMQEIAASHYPAVNTSLIHKKINLAEDHLFWEHERFSLKRIQAFTLTSLSSSKLIKRRTILVSNQENHSKRIETNLHIIGEALARELYGPLTENLFSNEFSISKPFISSLMKHLMKHSKAQNLLFTRQKDLNYYLAPLLKTMKTLMKKYSNEIQTQHYGTDPKNPEFIFYEPVETKLFIYKTKSSIFDVIITIFIAIYLILCFLFIRHFDCLISFPKFIFNNSASKTMKIN
ncbi:hypothetical protein SSS_09998 [Sarcoptes scabiei]|uniref:Nicalin n=1 Tax=Sarcoptes scabiei TaxID=52283 RepID=A0A834RBC8_SARSC|nr:hypothetical protein SSS_09998 [Sarcoptes scabiei]